MPFLLSLVFSLQQKQRRQNSFCLEGGSWKWVGSGGKVAQTMYTHVSKCKNDKRREKKCNVIRAVQISPLILSMDTYNKGKYILKNVFLKY
jgi:hypothetical protein